MSTPFVFSTRKSAFCASRIGLWALVLLFPALGRAQEAPADPIFVSFQYNAPPSCPLEERAFTLLQSRSERVVRAEDAANAQRLVVDISADRAGYHGTLTVIRADAAQERRSMKGANCAEVVEALALTAALSIDPNATLTLSSPGPEEDAAAAASPGDGSSDAPSDGSSPAQPTAPADRSPADSGLPPDAPRRRFRYSAPGAASRLRTTVGGVLSFARIMDSSPHLGGGVSVSLSEPGGRVLFPLEAHLTLQAWFEPDPDDPPRISTRLYLAQLSYCPLHIGVNFSFAACGRLDLGALSGQSVGFDQSDSEAEDQVTRFYAAAGAEGRLSLLLAEHWTLWAAPALLFPLTEREFAVEPGPDVLSSTLDVAWSSTLGFGWTF